jgi:hypothetical protein|tara:strand:- start:671 stop:856 length:186 start_codon:yes stop_codon:yes gene_type:complete
MKPSPTAGQQLAISWAVPGYHLDYHYEKVSSLIALPLRKKIYLSAGGISPREHPAVKCFFE